VLNGAEANWCVQCGMKLPFAAHFCPACGRRSVAVPPVTHAVGAPAPPDQVSRSIIAFAFAVSSVPSVSLSVISEHFKLQDRA
jgi:predicted amidophosphoribosyltransferase